MVPSTAIRLCQNGRIADRQQLARVRRILLKVGETFVMQIGQDFQLIVVGTPSGRFPECPLDLTVETRAAFLEDSLTESADRLDEDRIVQQIQRL